MDNIHYLTGSTLCSFITEYCEDHNIFCDEDFLNMAFSTQARPISETEAALRIEQAAYTWHLHGASSLETIQ